MTRRRSRSLMIVFWLGILLHVIILGLIVVGLLGVLD
jgi:hypothetical protein